MQMIVVLYGLGNNDKKKFVHVQYRCNLFLQILLMWCWLNAQIRNPWRQKTNCKVFIWVPWISIVNFRPLKTTSPKNWWLLEFLCLASHLVQSCRTVCQVQQWGNEIYLWCQRSLTYGIRGGVKKKDPSIWLLEDLKFQMRYAFEFSWQHQLRQMSTLLGRKNDRTLSGNKIGYKHVCTVCSHEEGDDDTQWPLDYDHAYEHLGLRLDFRLNLWPKSWVVAQMPAAYTAVNKDARCQHSVGKHR